MNINSWPLPPLAPVPYTPRSPPPSMPRTSGVYAFFASLNVPPHLADTTLYVTLGMLSLLLTVCVGSLWRRRQRKRQQRRVVPDGRVVLGHIPGASSPAV